MTNSPPANATDSNVEQSDDAKVSSPRRRWLFKLILVGGTTLFTLVLLEVAVRIMNPPIQVGPALVRFSETLGFELKPNLDCRRRSSEYDTTIQTNSLGMRGPEVAMPKPDGVVRVLCIGDSFTFGRGVDHDETFVQLLEQQLNERNANASYELLNAGVVGWGTGNQLIYLQECGIDLAPDIVLLQMYKNDFDDNMRSTLFTLGNDGELQRGQAYEGLKTITTVFNAIPGKSLLENSYLFNYARTFLNISVRPGGRGEDELSKADQEKRKKQSHQLTAKLLRQFVQEVRKRDLTLVVMTIDMEPDQAKAVDDVLRSEKVPVLPLDRMKGVHSELYFKYDFHWNTNGHQHTAEEVARFLIDNDLLPK